MIRRLVSVWHARNLEFVRDRSTLLFTLVMPVMLIVGMSFVFGGQERPLFKVGVLSAAPLDKSAHPFLHERFVDFVPIASESDGLHKVTHQQIDLLLDLPHRGVAAGARASANAGTGENGGGDASAGAGADADAGDAQGPPRYWVNTDSPKGYIVEKLLLASAPTAKRERVTGTATRYIDWLFPGILGMNMMFSCLFGVGYVVLRYRKNGFLKRLHATPLTAFEFLSAQVLSRLCLILFVTVLLYIGIASIIHFHSAGSLLLLFVLAVLASLSMIALGLTIAARFASEELVAGLLNLLTWPMMLLSGIWFSLEGSPQWVQWLASIFPLTHLLEASRAIMLDGAGVAQIVPDLIYLGVTAVAFLVFGAWSFRWRIE
ncbi:MAG TPA: ABC transporter permease [Steroidobacteraceae bacterium]|nr:ABC transporter permease [Steroidobacteraceae bacterium]